MPSVCTASKYARRQEFQGQGTSPSGMPDRGLRKSSNAPWPSPGRVQCRVHSLASLLVVPNCTLWRPLVNIWRRAPEVITESFFPPTLTPEELTAVPAPLAAIFTLAGPSPLAQTVMLPIEIGEGVVLGQSTSKDPTASIDQALSPYITTRRTEQLSVSERSRCSSEKSGGEARCNMGIGYIGDGRHVARHESDVSDWGSAVQDYADCQCTLAVNDAPWIFLA